MAKALNVSLSVTANTSQARTELQSLQTQLSNLVNSAGNINLTAGLKTSELSKAVTMTAELSQHLKDATNINTGTLNFTQLQKSLTISGNSLTAYGQQLLKLGPQGQQAFSQLASAVAKSEVPISRANTLMGQFWTTLKNTARWQISSSMLHGFIGALSNAYRYAQDLNESLNRIQIVTGLSDTAIAKFAENANKAAKSLSVTTTSYTDAALIYYQQGIRDQKQIAERVAVTEKMANVSGQTAQEVSNQMTAIWNNFAKGGDNLEYYADVITALGAATASSSEEISTGLQKFAAIADTVGLSYENASAALATITATTRQSADTVGTGLRTLFARLQSLSLGETLEDGVNLTKYTKALKTVGVEALDAEGNLRRMDDVLADLGEKWQNLSEAQKTALAQTVGGVRQYTTLFALMENNDFYKQNQLVAKNAQGTLQQQQEIFEKSWGAAQKRLKASNESLISDLLNDKFFIGLTDTLSNILNIVDKIVDALGGIGPILSGIATIWVSKNMGTLKDFFTSKAFDFMTIFPKGRNILYQNRQQQANELANMYKESAMASGNRAGIVSAQNLQNELTWQNQLLINADMMSAKEQEIAQARLDGLRQAGQEYVKLIQQADQATEKTKNAYNSWNTAMARNAIANGENWDTIRTNARNAQILTGDFTTKNINGQNYSTIGLSQLYAGLGSMSELYSGFSNLTSMQQALNAVAFLGERLSPGALAATNDQTKLSVSSLLSSFQQDVNSKIGTLTPTSDEGQVAAVADSIRGSFTKFIADVFQIVAATPLENGSAVDAAAQEEGRKIVQEIKGRQGYDQYHNIGSTPPVGGTPSAGGTPSTGGTPPAGGMPLTGGTPPTKKEDFSGISKIAGNLAQVTSAAMTTTMAISSLNSAFNSLEQGGLSSSQKLAVGLQMVTAASVGLGNNLANIAKMGLSSFGGILSLISIIATIGFAIYKAYDLSTENQEERIERLKDQAKNAEEAAKEASQAYQKLLSIKDEHTGLLDTLSNLTKGTLEFRDALIQSNELIQSIIQDYDLVYGKDWYRDASGAWIITPETWNDLQEKQIFAAEKSQETTWMSQYRANTSQSNIQVAPIGQTKQFEDYEIEDLTWFMNFFKGWSQLNNGKTLQSFIEENSGVLTPTEGYVNLPNGYSYQVDSTGGYLSVRDDTGKTYGFGTSAQEIINSIVLPYLEQNGFSFEEAFNLSSQQIQFDEINSLKNLMSGWATEGDNIIDPIESAIIDQMLQSETFSTRAGERGWEDQIFESNADFQKAISANTEDEQEKLLRELYTEYYHTEAAKDATVDWLRGQVESQILINALSDMYNKRLANFDDDLKEQFKNYEQMSYTEILAQTQLLDQNDEDQRLISEFMRNEAQKSIDNFRLALAKTMDSDILTDENDEIAQFIATADKRTVDKATSIITQYTSAFGKNTGAEIGSSILRQWEQNDTSLLDTLQEVQMGETRLRTLVNLKTIGKRKGIDLSQLISTAIDEIGPADLFQELYESEGFSDILSDLQEEFVKTGKIGAENILEAAKANEELNELLTDGEVNANGLAQALSAIELGDINVDQLTDGLLRALSASGQVQNNLAIITKMLNDFNAEPDIRDIGSFFSSGSKVITESVKEGAYFNPQALQYMEMMFGPEATANFERDVQGWLSDTDMTYEQIQQNIQDTYGDMWTAMEGVMEYGDLGPLIEWQTQHNKDLQQFITTDEQGNIDFSEDFAARFETIDDFITALMEEAHLNETLARAIAADMDARSGVHMIWQKGGLKQGLGELFSEDNGFITSAQVETFFTWNQKAIAALDKADIKDIFGVDVDTIDNLDFSNGIDSLEEFLLLLQATEKKILDLGKDFSWSDENAAQKVKEAYEKTYGKNSWAEYWKDNGVSEDGTGQIDKMVEGWKRLGASEAEAYQQIDQQLKDGTITDLSVETKTALGDSIQSWQDWSKSVEEGGDKSAAAYAKYVQETLDAAEATKQATDQANIIADAFVTAFTKTVESEGIKINLTLNPESEEEITGKLDDFKNVDGIITYQVRFVDKDNNEIAYTITPGGNEENGGVPQVEVDKTNVYSASLSPEDYSPAEKPQLSPYQTKSWREPSSLSTYYTDDYVGAKIFTPTAGRSTYGSQNLNSIVGEAIYNIISGKDLSDGAVWSKDEQLHGLTAIASAYGFSNLEDMVKGFQQSEYYTGNQNANNPKDQTTAFTDWLSHLEKIGEELNNESNGKITTGEEIPDNAKNVQAIIDEETGATIQANVEFDHAQVEAAINQDGDVEVHGKIEVEDENGETKEITYDAIIDPDTGQLTELQVKVPDQVSLINPDTKELIDLDVAIPDQIATIIPQVDEASLNAIIGKIKSAAGGGIDSAMGLNNAAWKNYAGGRHDNNDYQGMATVGELGPELWIHDGQPYLTGLQGRTTIYVTSGDSIFTAGQTKKILQDNPGLQDIPGFAGGEGNFTGYLRPDGKATGSGANSDNKKTKEFEPERYHVITRQLQELNRLYEQLSKVKDNAYGTNKLDAIQQEINATDKLIEGQRILIKEAEDYVDIDLKRLKELGVSFKLDDFGNISNWEELQDTIGRAAASGEDENAVNQWKAIQQYEETIDKLHEAQDEMQDYIYQLATLELEKITTKVELVVDMDERQINFIDYFLDKMTDDIYDVADALDLINSKMSKIQDQIKITEKGLTDIFAKMKNDYGEDLAKEDQLTIDKIIDMGKNKTGEEIAKALDPLHINGDFGATIEEFADNILDYLEALNKLKTEGVDRLEKAFNKMNENVSNSIDLFNYYNEILSTMKTLTELQGTTISKELKDLGKEINKSILANSMNELEAEQIRYADLQHDVNTLKQEIANETDKDIKMKLKDMLKDTEDKLRESNQNILSIIQNALEQIKTEFEENLDEITSIYESAISGMYGTTNELQNAFDRKKEINDFYVDDYEKYYQIAKLQRSITSDLDKAAKAGNRSNQGLKKLYDEINAARENGVELTEYDLDIFSKRYEYEKALMELEDARNAKSEVRLQRDANGNWGYVYTSSADEDELVQKQQAVDDKLYEWQKTIDTQTDEVQGTILDALSSVTATAADMIKNGSSKEAVEDFVNDSIEKINLFANAMGVSLSDAFQTIGIANERYMNPFFSMLTNSDETLLYHLLGTNPDEAINLIYSSVEEMFGALDEYNKQIKDIDKKGGYEDFISQILQDQQEINEQSKKTLTETTDLIGEYSKTFDNLIIETNKFEQNFFEKYGKTIEEWEEKLQALLNVLDALNRYEIKDEGAYKSKPVIPAKTSSNNNQDEKSNTEEEEEESKPCPHKWEETAGSHPEGMYYIHVQKCLWCGAKRTFKTLYSASGPKAVPMDTGGYTGSWGTEGRIAMLHEKELVLNKDDTKNFLDATNILRTIDLQTNMFSKGLGNIITPWIDDMRLQELEQDVHIEASFPNVVDHNEIEMAFDNLINKASQYANRKNMSSMTFQDMYTSKF